MVDVHSGALVAKRNAWRKLIPASNEKLFTSTAAFSRLATRVRVTDTT